MRAAIVIGLLGLAGAMLYFRQANADEFPIEDFEPDPAEIPYMKTSANGIEAIKRREGFSPVPYPDASGFSIGYGHFIKPGESFTEIDEATATQLLAADLADAEAAISAGVTVGLSQGQYDALASFIYNVGVGAFRKSTLLRKLNAGDFQGAAEEFSRWNKSQGAELAALTTRRAEEAAQFSQGA